MIDVVFPVYNCERYVSDALESILAQTFSDFCCYVVDDASTDNTLAVVQGIAARDSRVVVVEKSSNSGLVDSLNVGIAKGDRPYIARMDGDDWCYPNRFQHQLSLLRQCRDLVALSCSYQVIDGGGNLSPTACFNGEVLGNGHLSIPAYHPNLQHPFVMMRRDIVERLGGYRQFKHAEDADLFFRMQVEGKLLNDPMVLGHYRIHDKSVSQKSRASINEQNFYSQLSALSRRRVEANVEDVCLSDIRNSLALLNLESHKSITEFIVNYSGFNWEERNDLLESYILMTFNHAEWRGYRLSDSSIRELSSCYRQLPSKRLKRQLKLYMRIRRKWGRVAGTFFDVRFLAMHKYYYRRYLAK